MAMAQHLLKAYWTRGFQRLLSPLSSPASRRLFSDGLCSICPSWPVHFDFCGAEHGSVGLSQALRRHRIGHFCSLGLRSRREHRFFSVHGGSEDSENGDSEEAGDKEELSAEEDEDEEGNQSGDEDDALQLATEASIPLPNFQNFAEEAAYIGYKVVGQIKAGDFDRFKSPKAFAVVQVGSHQFKISPGDCIYTEKLKFADVNDKLSLEKVLLLGSNSQTVIGRPFVPKAFVHAAVEEQVLDAKVIIFKKKRRKNYRRTTGHRQELTRLRILEIWGLGEARLAVA